jgi:hypothetical protein
VRLMPIWLGEMIKWWEFKSWFFKFRRRLAWRVKPKHYTFSTFTGKLYPLVVVKRQPLRTEGLERFEWPGSKRGWGVGSVSVGKAYRHKHEAYEAMIPRIIEEKEFWAKEWGERLEECQHLRTQLGLDPCKKVEVKPSVG